MPDLRLETERLLLTPLSAEHVEGYCAMMADDEVAKFVTKERKGLDRMAAWRGLALAIGHWQIRGHGFFAVIEKSTGDYVGNVGPWEPEGWPSLECGWTIARPHWGKGYAPEAAIAAIRWIFATYPELDRIISLIDDGNVNSQAVARKIGEQRTGEVFELWDLTLPIWACPREEWLARFA